MKKYDAIVVGLGGIGSATLHEFTKRGLCVLGLERFEIGHDRGSSHGETRIFRQAYFEHPDYVPLLKRAYELWHELNRQSGQTLFHEVGLIEVGPPDGIVIPGIKKSAHEHQLQIHELDHQQFKRDFPQFQKGETDIVVFEPTAGYLLVDDCVRRHVAMAVANGAEILPETAVRSIQPDSYIVRTDAGDYAAQFLVITVGSWISELLTLPVPFRILRKHLDWFQCDDHRYRADANCPAFFYEHSGAFFYGFPSMDSRIKVAEHSGGEVLSDPNDVDPRADAENTRRLIDFLRDHLPGVSKTHLDHQTCMYTMTPDEHFIVDAHPRHSNMAITAGLSGHGFKFAPVLAEAMVQLLLDGKSQLPIEFLGLDRFAD